MENKRDITTMQLAVILINTMIGVTILALPRFVIVEAETAAPSATVGGALIILLGIVIITYLGRAFPNQTLVGYTKHLLGKFGAVLLIALVILFLLITGLQSRQFGEVIVTSLLPNTPIYVPILIMGLLVVTTSFQAPTIFAYIQFFYLFLTLAPIYFIVIAALGDIDTTNALPILGNEATFKGIMSGGLYVTQVMQSFIIISMIIPFLRKPESAMKAGFWGWFITATTILIIVTVVLAVFGVNEVENMMWPTLVLGRLVRIPAEILQRLDAIFLISWIVAVFTSLLSVYYFVVRLITELFSLKNQRLVALFLYPVVFLVAMWPEDIFQMYDWVFNLRKICLYFTLGIPLLLLVVFKMKGRQEASA